MTADHAFSPGPVNRSPDAIRAALPPSDRALFEAEYGAALDGAKATYSLREVDAVVERWWRFAHLAGGHEESVRIAEQVLADQEVDTVPVDFAALRG